MNKIKRALHIVTMALKFGISAAQAQNQTAVVQAETELNRYLLQNTISGICRDTTGGIWAASQFGLLYSDGTDTRLIHKGNEKQLTSNRFLGIYQLEEGYHVTVNSSNQIFLLGNSGVLYPYTLTQGQRLLIHGNNGFIIQDRDWDLPQEMSTIISPELFHYDDAIIGFQEYGKWFGKTASSGRKNKYYLSKKAGHSHFIRDDNEIFFYTDGALKYHKTLHQGIEDIVRLDDSSVIIRLKNQLVFLNLIDGESRFAGNINPLRMGEAVLVYPLNKQMYFVGTYNFGIYELNLIPAIVLTGAVSETQKNLYIYSYARWKDSIFITSYEGLIKVSEYVQGQKKLHSAEVSSSSLIVDEQSRIWSSQDKLIGYYNFPSGKFHSLGSVPLTPDIFFIIGNNLFFTIHEHIYKINTTSGNFTKHRQIKGAGRFYGLRSTHAAHYLMSENGLYQINESVEVITHLHKGYIFRDLIETPSGIYIATYGDGLLRMETNGKLNRVFSDRFAWSNTALSLRYDDRNRRLWLISNKGIFILELDTRGLPRPDYSLLACGSELPSTELNGGDYVILPGDKYFYFPSNNGLIKVPIDWNLRKKPAEVMLKSASSAGKPVPVSDQIYLQAGHKNLIIKLLIPFSFHEENESQEYRLLPLFQLWRPIPENRQLLFSQLPPGEYTLWVKNALGERRLTTIHVAKFWFQEHLFYLALVMFIIGVVILSIFIRTRRLKRRSLLLEASIEKKTEELQRNLKTLEKSQWMLQQETSLRENMNSVLLHDIRSPLLFLTQSSYNLNNMLKERFPQGLDSANVLAGTVKDLYFLSSEYIVWLKNRKSGAKAETETLKLCELLDEILRFYRPICSSNYNSIEFNCDEENERKTFCTDGQLLRCVLRNLIDNSNKYTRNGNIRIELKHEEGFADITVYDNGNGLPARVLTTFARRSKENPNLWTLKAMPTEEIGINMILQFAEMLHGVITYERLPEGRSSFHLRLKELTCQSSDSESSLKSMP